MGSTPFAKYEGLGNDFVLIETRDESRISGAAASRICERRTGVGADGVLLVLPPRTAGAHARMKVINADGSVPETCGNGLRCVALHVARGRGLEAAELVIDTDAGDRPCAVERASAPEPAITVDMGRVRVLGDASLRVGGVELPFVLADAGNPHAVHLGEVPRAEIERLGPLVATHPRFPKGTNVEFVTTRGDSTAEALIWERGVGITLACGSGACATAAVLVHKGLAPTGAEIAVSLLGGVLSVRVKEDGSVSMRGPARLVYTGELFE